MDITTINTPVLYIIAVILVFIIVFIWFLLKLISKKTFSENINKLPFEITELETALGGRDNLLDFKSTPTRLNVNVNDIKIVNIEKLKGLGVSGIVEKSNGYSLIFGAVAPLIEEKLRS